MPFTGPICDKYGDYVGVVGAAGEARIKADKDFLPISR